MLASIVRTMLKQRLLVVVVALALCGAGLYSTKSLSVDAFPDVTNIQVMVATVSVGRSPEEIERLVTVPVELAMIGLPGLVEMRSINKSGLSLITLVFTDQTDVYFARQLVMERLIEVSPTLLPGINPVLGPVTTGLGEVYQYTLEHPDDGERALIFVQPSADGTYRTSRSMSSTTWKSPAEAWYWLRSRNREVYDAIGRTVFEEAHERDSGVPLQSGPRG